MIYLVRLTPDPVNEKLNWQFCEVKHALSVVVSLYADGSENRCHADEPEYVITESRSSMMYARGSNGNNKQRTKWIFMRAMLGQQNGAASSQESSLRYILGTAAGGISAKGWASRGHLPPSLYKTRLQKALRTLSHFECDSDLAIAKSAVTGGGLALAFCYRRVQVTSPPHSACQSVKTPFFSRFLKNRTSSDFSRQVSTPRNGFRLETLNKPSYH